MAMTNVYPSLVTLRDSLAGLAGVATCRIGIEANMTPADYPMVRIVPENIEDDSTMGRRRTAVLIYFGQPIHEFDAGLEALWQSHLTMETAIVDRAFQTTGITFEYVETILDEDRIEAYKVMAVRGVVVG